MAEKSILVVDDDHVIRDSLTEFLKTEGFKTGIAATVKEASAELEKQNYALVITEINLPDGDGFQLLDLVRHNYRRRSSS